MFMTLYPSMYNITPSIFMTSYPILMLSPYCFHDNTTAIRDISHYLQCSRPSFDPSVGNIPGRRECLTHSNILAWRISWTVNPWGSKESDATFAFIYHNIHTDNLFNILVSLVLKLSSSNDFSLYPISASHWTLTSASTVMLSPLSLSIAVTYSQFQFETSHLMSPIKYFLSIPSIILTSKIPHSHLHLESIVISVSSLFIRFMSSFLFISVKFHNASSLLHHAFTLSSLVFLHCFNILSWQNNNLC